MGRTYTYVRALPNNERQPLQSQARTRWPQKRKGSKVNPNLLPDHGCRRELKSLCTCSSLTGDDQCIDRQCKTSRSRFVEDRSKGKSREKGEASLARRKETAVMMKLYK